MFMQAYTSQTYALLRIMTGLLFIWHGLHKLFSFPAVPHLDAMGKPPLFIVYIAGPIELIGGLLVMVGLFTRRTQSLTALPLYFRKYHTSQKQS